MELNTDYFKIVLRWAWLLVLAAVVAGGATYWFSQQQPTVYEAKTRLIIGPGIESPNPGLDELRTGGLLMQTYAELATTDPILRSVIDELGLNTTPGLLRENLTVRPQSETQILTINVAYNDPATVAAIANTIADKLVQLSSESHATDNQFRMQMRREADRLEEIIADTEERIAELEAELASLLENEAPPDPLTQEIIRNAEARIAQLEGELEATEDIETQRFLLDQLANERTRLLDAQQQSAAAQQRISDQLAQERTRLSDAHRTLATLYESLQDNSTNQVKIVERAEVGSQAASQLKLRVLMGVIGGLTVALSSVFAYEYLDSSIKTSEILERVAGVPVLGTITRQKALLRSDDPLLVHTQPKSRTAEDYRMLGTKLLFSKGNKESHSLLISSPKEHDTYTAELAANLAIALSQTERNVVLVDANLRNPTVSELFAVNEASGWADVLTDRASDVTPIPIEWSPGLAVLPTGSSSDEAFRFLASSRMNALIEELKEHADIVVVAAAPLLSFADSLILASRVDRVLLVAYSGETTRQHVHDAVDQLRLVDAHLAGAILETRSKVPLVSSEPKEAVREPSPETATRAVQPAKSEKTLT